MKKIFLIFISIIMFIVLAAAVAGVYIMYSSDYSIEDVIGFITGKAPNTSDVEIEQTKDEVTVNSSSNENDIPKQKVTYSSALSEEHFYYQQLNKNQKIFYDGFQNNKENMISGKYIIEYGDTFSDLLETETGLKTLQKDYQTAIEAYTHDNPELFYLDITKLYLNIETIKKVWTKKYNVYVGPRKGETYYHDYLSGEEEVREIYNQIYKVKERILDGLSHNTYDKIKKIHDYLIETIQYDSYSESKGTYSVYGALVEKKCVCDGYARAFKYLANAADVECEIIQGIATNNEGKAENHAWNAVNLQGKWYYIDATWDDPVVVGRGYIKNSYRYQYFLRGSEFLNITHYLDGKFSEGGFEFSYPQVSVKDYEKRY